MPTRRKADGRLWLAIEAVERHEICEALDTHMGNVEDAAEDLEVGRSYLYRACMRLGIDLAHFREDKRA